jgi:hypothetical protein
VSCGPCMPCPSPRTVSLAPILECCLNADKSWRRGSIHKPCVEAASTNLILFPRLIFLSTPSLQWPRPGPPSAPPKASGSLLPHLHPCIAAFAQIGVLAQEPDAEGPRTKVTAAMAGERGASSHRPVSSGGGRTRREGGRARRLSAPRPLP